jgi:hypothetical protein
MKEDCSNQYSEKAIISVLLSDRIVHPYIQEISYCNCMREDDKQALKI